ncbi:alpha/beta hydrolase [Spirilliplanes yamanashiensis]
MGAGGLGLVEARVVPGRSVLDRAVGRCDVEVPPATVAPGLQQTGTFDSALRRQRVSWVVAYPPGAQPGAKLPVCLVLHGYGATAATAIGAAAYDRHLATHVAGGGDPFVLAAMDGGDGYWHPHDGDDPLGALLREFVPMLAGRGLRTDRLAAIGWSMGGYGAMLCALTDPQRFVAVAASAPAIWRSYDEARAVNAGAFASAQEWARYDVLAQAHALSRVRVRIDCGESDPFAPAVRDLRDRLPDSSVVRFTQGCHDNAYFSSVAPDQLKLVGVALTGGVEMTGK